MTALPFPRFFALSSCVAEEAAASAAANQATPAGAAVVYPTPHHIPVRRGANAEDLEHMSRQIKLCETLFKSTIVENAKLYHDAVAAIIENQAENVPISRGVRVKSFEYTLLDIIDDLDRALTDLTSDVQGDIERSLEDY